MYYGINMQVGKNGEKSSSPERRPPVICEESGNRYFLFFPRTHA